MVRETCVTSKVPIPFCAGDSNARECARGTRHAVSTRLVAGVRDVSCTRFVAPLTHELSSHCPSKFSDHVIMPFDIVTQYIKYF